MLSSLRLIMQQIQQYLFRKVWANHTVKRQEIKDFMIIKGKIVNVVRLSDINKNVQYNQEVHLTDFEVEKSKDLENAIRRQWVEIILDKGSRIGKQITSEQVLKQTIQNVANIIPGNETADKTVNAYFAQKPTTTVKMQPVEVAQQIKQEDIMAMAKKMAKEMAPAMAEEMIKNSPLVKEIAKELAQQMIAGIKDNLKIEQHVVMQSTQSTEKVPVTIDNQENNMFIDFDDEEIQTESNIKNIGTVEVKQESLDKSLEKMKRFKRNV